jgi:PilZ domain
VDGGPCAMRLTKNLRKYGRSTFLSQVSLSAPGGVAVEVSSLDISLCGVGLISRVFVQTGRGVTLAFHLKNSANVAVVERVQGRVVFARSDVDGHRLRVAFHESLNRQTNPELTRKVENL